MLALSIAETINSLGHVDTKTMESPEVQKNACAGKSRLCFGVRICFSGGEKFNCIKQTKQMSSLLKLKGTTLGIARIAIAAVTKIKETAVSLVQNLLPSLDAKRGHSRQPKSLSPWRNLPNRQKFDRISGVSRSSKKKRPQSSKKSEYFSSQASPIPKKVKLTRENNASSDRIFLEKGAGERPEEYCFLMRMFCFRNADVCRLAVSLSGKRAKN